MIPRGNLGAPCVPGRSPQQHECRPGPAVQYTATPARPCRGCGPPIVTSMTKSIIELPASRRKQGATSPKRLVAAPRRDRQDRRTIRPCARKFAPHRLACAKRRSTATLPAPGRLAAQEPTRKPTAASRTPQPRHPYKQEQGLAACRFRRQSGGPRRRRSLPIGLE